jgi:hypothetical protein
VRMRHHFGEELDFTLPELAERTRHLERTRHRAA